MGMSTSTSKPYGKWYDSARVSLFLWSRFSDEELDLLRQEIKEDRQAKLDANLMMANYAFGQAHEWVCQLDIQPRTYQEFVGIGQIRWRAVQKWLRDFWADEDVPLPKPNLFYLSSTPTRNNWVWEKWVQRKEQGEDRFKTYFQAEWTNDAVYSREEVEKMVDRGEISPKRADEMLRLRWEVNRKGEKVAKDWNPK
jgi:hypothetical protein